MNVCLSSQGIHLVMHVESLWTHSVPTVNILNILNIMKTIILQNLEVSVYSKKRHLDSCSYILGDYVIGLEKQISA